jgi:hypothetical protein
MSSAIGLRPIPRKEGQRSEFAKPDGTLLLPCHRAVSQHFSEPQPLGARPCLPRRCRARCTSAAGAGTRKHLSRPPALRGRYRLCPTALDPPRHRWARTSALTRVSSRRGFGVGAAAPSGVMISFRPPRRCSRIGIRIVRVSTSWLARSVITPLPPSWLRGRARERQLARPPALRRGCGSGRRAA